MKPQEIAAGNTYTNGMSTREVESVRYWYKHGQPVWFSPSSRVVYWMTNGRGARVRKDCTLFSFARWAVSRVEEAREQPTS